MSRFHTSPLLASVLSICKSYWFPFWQKNNNKKGRLKKLQKRGSVTPPKFDREITSPRRTRGVEFMLCSQFQKFHIKMSWNQAWIRWSRTPKAVQKSSKCCRNVVKIAMRLTIFDVLDRIVSHKCLRVKSNSIRFDISMLSIWGCRDVEMLSPLTLWEGEQELWAGLSKKVFDFDAITFAMDGEQQK